MPRRKKTQTDAPRPAKQAAPAVAPDSFGPLRDDTKISPARPDEDLSDVTEFESQPTPRRRGRPLKNPEAGPATAATRAADRRKRIAKENRDLVMCLWKALHSMRWAGEINEVASAFHAYEAGFAAVRRISPRTAKNMFDLVSECWTLRTEFHNRLFGAGVTPGKVKGSIVFDGHEYIADKRGRVLRDGEPTEYVMSGTRGFYRVTNTVVTQPPRLHGSQDGRAMALLDVAIMIFEKETGTRVTSRNIIGATFMHPMREHEAKLKGKG